MPQICWQFGSGMRSVHAERLETVSEGCKSATDWTVLDKLYGECGVKLPVRGRR